MFKTDFSRLLAVSGLAAGLALGGAAQAEEVAEGTVLNAASIDGLLDKTLDGQTIRDGLLGQQERMIREFGWSMKLIKSKPFQPVTGIVELTEKHKGEASLDANKHMVGHVTGVPFPDLDPADPDAGYKLAYNILRVGWVGDAMDLNPLNFLIVDGKKGLEREQSWLYRRYLMSGRLGEPHVEKTNLGMVDTKTRTLGTLHNRDQFVARITYQF